jgi:hypothetical chaperone protein
MPRSPQSLQPSSDPSIGIDFGTTNSSIALARGDDVQLLEFADGRVSSRSILYLEKARQGIRSSSGATAIDRYLAAHREGHNPGRLIQSLKSYLTSRTLTGTEVFGRHYLLEELISRILTDLRLAAEEQFGQPVRQSTVGCPVRFVGSEGPDDDAFGLERLRQAFLRAGFEQVRFEYEPLGAAWSFQARDSSTRSASEVVLIGDFGGGTSDFSLLRLGPGGQREVLGTSGLPFAGDAFDARLVRKLVSPALGSESLARGPKAIPAVPAWIYANLERWHYLSFLRTRNVLDLLTSARKRALEPDKIDSLLAIIDEDLGYQLHQAVQRTKTALSSAGSADFIFAGPDAGSVELRTSVTRSDFEQWIAPELGQIATAIESLLAGCTLAQDDVSRVFLTGGTSFVPAVRALFESRFAGRVVTGDEFTSVAQGLALSR